MQVRKYEASSVLEALKEVKRDLGPDAIILSTQESKKSAVGTKKFIVVAAVTENQFKKKELAEKKLGSIYEEKVQSKPAHHQRHVIENVYQRLEKKHEEKNRKFTQIPYIDIIDSNDTGKPGRAASEAPSSVENISTSAKRVKTAAREAFKSSLNLDLFQKEKPSTPVSNSALPEKEPRVALLSAALANMVQKLKSCGVDSDICAQFQEQANRELGENTQRKAIVDSWFAKKILNEVRVADQKQNRQVEIFVGPQGSGKTASLIKMATHYKMNEQSNISIITTDTNKVGGVEQLRVYSRILNAPVFVVNSIDDLERKISDLHAYNKIFVDTPGISLSCMDEVDFMKAIAMAKFMNGKSTHLVVSALTKSGDLGGILKRFRVAQFNDIIVTGIDQTSQHGILLNIQEKVSMPFHSFGIGSDIVDGFEFASRERVLDLIFKLTKPIGERANDSSI